MESQVVHSFKKSDTEEIRVSLREYKNKAYVDVRLFFQAGEEFKPTKKGITLGVEHLFELRAGVEKAQEVALQTAS